jgi:hypothetical protein
MESEFKQEGNHVVSIPEVNTEELARDMKEEIERCTKGLESNPGAMSSRCIYEVPLRFKDNNGSSYRPRIVSIGPKYYYDTDLKLYSDCKYQCLGFLLKRNRVKGLQDYLDRLRPCETKARECYPEEMIQDFRPPGDGDFLEMMVLDASFILELFYMFQDPRLGPLKADEPPASLKWRLPYFYVDLILLQNQIPFFVLQELFDISKMPDDPSLSLLALRFFNNVMSRPNEVIERYGNPKTPPLHLLDLVRSSLIPYYQKPPQKDENKQIQSIPCMSQLRRSGIRVRPGKAESFLAVKFKRGVVEMPSITINDFMRYLLLNCVAFEQCHNSCPKHVTVYATFLDCLVNTSSDVQYLREHNVIDNHLADDDKVARFINSLGKDVTFDIRDFYLSKLFNDVDKHYRNNFCVNWASLRRRYCNTRWWFISACAAILLLLLTFAQTFYTIIGYVHPKK